MFVGELVYIGFHLCHTEGSVPPLATDALFSFIKYGVPQGSVFGPFFYSHRICSFSDCITDLPMIFGHTFSVLV